MTGLETFDLVKSLSRKEKSNFTRFVRIDKANKPEFYILYEKFSDAESYDEEKIRALVGLNTPKKFYKVRMTLLDRIIQSLTFYSKGSDNSRKYILTALEKGAYDLAKKKLISLAATAYKERDFSYLAYLYKLKVEIWAAYKVAVEFPKEVPGEVIVKDHLERSTEVRSLLESIKVEVKKGNSDRDERLLEISHGLEAFKIDLGVGGYFLRKGKAISCLLLYGEERAVQDYHLTLDYLRSQSFPLKEIHFLEELKDFILLNSMTGNLDCARDHIWELDSVPALTLEIEKRKAKILCKVNLHFALNHGGKDLAEIGYASMKTYSQLFTKEELAISFFSYAIVSFVYGCYSECIKVLEELKSLNQSHWENLKWPVKLVSLLANWEIQNLDVIDSLYLGLKRLASNSNLHFPKIATQFIGRVIFTPNPAWEKEWDLLGASLDSLMGDSKERICFEVFNLGAWVKAKASRLPLENEYFKRKISNRIMDLVCG